MTTPSIPTRRPTVRGGVAPAAPTTDPGPRERRHRALAAAKRDLVLDAARAAFFSLGMEKTSIREIAQRAGYAPGAIYQYFPSKEAIYGALLDESLVRLDEHVAKAVARRRTPATRLAAAAGAFFDFYLANPRDLDLGFYLFQGMKPRGLGPELDEHLNARLLAALAPTGDALEAMGLSPAAALKEVTALFAHAVGLLVLSHTGRIRMFRQASRDLFDDYVDRLAMRAGGRPPR